jgi:hypothetical protein
MGQWAKAVMTTEAVLGFRPHTYWTAAVAVAADGGEAMVVERRKLVFAAGKEKFAFHQAAETTPEAGAALIERVRAATTANAAREVGHLIDDLAARGFKVRTAVTAAAIAKLPPRLEDILTSHARIHSAEGSLYRDVVAAGCEVCGLTVHRLVERELAALVADRLETTPAGLKSRLQSMGLALGPPWNEDIKLAVLAAWTQL